MKETVVPAFSDADFDTTFKVAVNGNKLYFHDGTDYMEIVESVFKPDNKIYLNMA